MLRTLQTATETLDWLSEKGVRFEANADWQGVFVGPGGAASPRRDAHMRFNTENSSSPCDTGRQIDEFVSKFPHVDFSAVDPVWPDKTSPDAKRYAYTRTDILQRGKLVLDALYARPERLIFVVSHSGFLRAGVTGRWYFNADYRIFKFKDEVDDNGRQQLLQDETTEGAGGMGWSWTEPVELGTGLPDGKGDA